MAKLQAISYNFLARLGVIHRKPYPFVRFFTFWYTPFIRVCFAFFLMKFITLSKQKKKNFLAFYPPCVQLKLSKLPGYLMIKGHLHAYVCTWYSKAKVYQENRLLVAPLVRSINQDRALALGIGTLALFSKRTFVNAWINLTLCMIKKIKREGHVQKSFV